MELKKVLLLSLMLIASAQVIAMDVTGYEAIVKESQGNGAGKYMSKAAIESYFNGVAVTLQYLQTGTNNIYKNGEPLLCFPAKVQITGQLLRGALDGELQKPAIFAEAFGLDWKKYELITFIVPSLLRMFPCPK